MKIQLERHLWSLHQLRERLAEVRSDLEYYSHGHTIYYTADFSEVFAYLHCDEEENVAVTLDPDDHVRASNQHRLGLAHLFHGLTHAIYLLPPYMIELWSYVRSQANQVHSLPDLKTSSDLAIQDLDDSTKQLLSTLRSDTELSDEQEKKLLGLIRDDFEKLSGDVNAFVTWNKRGDALKSLLDPKNQPHVSYEIQDVLRDKGVPEDQLKHPSSADEIRVFETFPDDAKWDKRYAKLVDARALVYLRDLNQILEPKGAKMVLVTRDHSMRRAAASLWNQRWFGWRSITEHLRGIETIFFDLILRSTPDIRDRIKWISESDLKLADMEDTVNDILAHMPTLSGADYEKELAVRGLDKFKRTSKLWDEHINLQLSLALAATPWLRDRFSDSFVRPSITLRPTGRTAAESRNLELLKNLWEFVSTPKYRDLAEEDAQVVWSELENEARRMSFLGQLGRESVDHLGQILSEPLTGKGGARTVLLSMSALRMPSIQFVSETYQVRLKTLKAYAKKGHESSSWLQKQFLPIVYEATSGISKPEDFLFMAFVLGMLELWMPALTMAEHSLHLSDPSQINRSEVYFFIAFAKRILGKLETTTVKEIERYVDAYEWILKALDEKADDPRFLLEQASIGLLYHEAIRNRGAEDRIGIVSASGDQKLPDVSAAKALMTRALAIERKRDSDSETDRRLIIDLLNNLAYAEVLSDTPNFDKAQAHLSEVEAEFEKPGHLSEIMLTSLRGRIEDTRIMIAARQAWHHKNLAGLQNALEELRAMCAKEYLSEAQLKVAEEHIALVQKWLDDLYGPAGS